jgi:predicted CopG family antitoxin
MDKDDKLFKDTSFSDLMSDIYHNSKKKDRQINQMIAQLQPLIKNASDATIIVPLIKEYLDISVKNDDHLIKLAAITQRYISTKQTISGADGLMSDDEKKQLLEIAEQNYVSELEDEIEEIKRKEDADERQLQSRVDQVKNKITKPDDN